MTAKGFSMKKLVYQPYLYWGVLKVFDLFFFFEINIEKNFLAHHKLFRSGLRKYDEIRGKGGNGKKSK